MSNALRSHSSGMLVAKYWGPIVCLLIAFSVFGGDFPGWRFLPALPFLLAAFFGLSLAAVEVHNGTLRYRRLFRWKTVPQNEILSARVEWPPLVGSIRFKNFVFPWGRVYFVLDKSSGPTPFQRSDSSILRFLVAGQTGNQETNSSLPPKSRASALRLISVAAMGMFTCSLLIYVLPSSSAHSTLNPTSPFWVRVQFQLVELLYAFPVQAVCFVILALLTVRRRGHPSAWLYAFFLGFALVPIVSRLL